VICSEGSLGWVSTERRGVDHGVDGDTLRATVAEVPCVLDGVLDGVS
jgi:hypothetical protein